MRVTQTMLNNNMLRNLNNSMRGMERYQEMLASGKRVNKPSDDPVGAVRSMFYRTTLVEIEQFQRNTSEGLNWMETTDQTMDSVVNVLHRVRELIVRASSDTMAEASRYATAQEIRELKDQIGNLANASIGGRYIFSGTDTKTAPYDGEAIVITEKDLRSIFEIAGVDENEDPLADFLTAAGIDADSSVDDALEELLAYELPPDIEDYEPIDHAIAALKEMYGKYSVTTGAFISDNSQEIKVEMGKNIFIPINILGSDIFLDSKDPDDDRKSVFRVLDDIILTLERGDTNELTGLLDDLDSNMDYIISSRASLGAKMNRIELIQARLADNNFSATSLLSDAEDADIPKVITNLKNQENVHRAALSTGARIIQPSLMDFLR
ncbi:flagellar hook-associated protein FlgL [Desulfuribacillus alkaliarsenatis]|uniref:Flagellin N-terminal domain-containing protein n=1 Tax=Desulfuribacillus alkaliarsenatis TaxID=766136 RepID=A0A1E5G3Q8_9FIRM|nr:flagellar hook-associated protein FlgL [Desulfuribacillus alkaliarsenatis]OEF97707.1 hypothetical protein BHF68_14000 [Desulfuribacillus alkaliarsenatis]